MSKQNTFTLCLLLFSLLASRYSLAQLPYEHLELNKHLQIQMGSLNKNDLLSAANELIGEMKNGQINTDKIHPTYGDLTQSIWSTFKDYHLPDPNNIEERYVMQLMQVYPLNMNQYMLSMAIVGESPTTQAGIRTLFDCVAEKIDGRFVFSLPLKFKTKTWQSKQVGNITYHFRDKINLGRADQFDKKNTEIAKKFNLKSENIQFFMTDNYQDFLNVIGINYSFDENGKYRDGYGVDGGCIFSIMHNEDFSHDIFHYYSGKVNERSMRNWITEEGVAYSWGNAYYTDDAGEMINQDRLVKALKQYIKVYPETDLLNLFEQNAKPFHALAKEASLRSLLSSLICDEVEHEHGMSGLLKLINCGRKDGLKQYFSATDDLVDLNRGNFNEKILMLIQAY